jgi:shikimate dehydrogenase
VRLGVIGWPVAHSLSPVFQNAALREVGLRDWRYGRLPIPPDLFDETARALPAAGYRGVNVTIPFKAAALALADVPSERARAIGAANTLVFEPGGQITADNTDAPGLIAALPDGAGTVTGCRVLVLGAGGSARAAVWALIEAGAGEVRVWNRDRSRARRLCDELGGRAVERAEPAELLVNCTSVGLNASDALEELPLDPGRLGAFGMVADFVYRDGGAVVTRAAREQGVTVVDGLELLIAQGALSFEQFTGQRAPREAMRAALALGPS